MPTELQSPAGKPPFFDINREVSVHYCVPPFPDAQALTGSNLRDAFSSLSTLYPCPTSLTMILEATGGVGTSYQRAGKLLFSHPTHMSQTMVVDRSCEEQLMVPNDARAGAIDVSFHVATLNDLSAGIDFVKGMYPHLEAVWCVCIAAMVLPCASFLTVAVRRRASALTHG